MSSAFKLPTYGFPILENSGLSKNFYFTDYAQRSTPQKAIILVAVALKANKIALDFFGYIPFSCLVSGAIRIFSGGFIAGTSFYLIRTSSEKQEDLDAEEVDEDEKTEHNFNATNFLNIGVTQMLRGALEMIPYCKSLNLIIDCIETINSLGLTGTTSLLYRVASFAKEISTIGVICDKSSSRLRKPRNEQLAYMNPIPSGMDQGNQYRAQESSMNLNSQRQCQYENAGSGESRPVSNSFEKISSFLRRVKSAVSRWFTST